MLNQKQTHKGSISGLVFICLCKHIKMIKSYRNSCTDLLLEFFPVSLSTAYLLQARKVHVHDFSHVDV